MNTVQMPLTDVVKNGNLLVNWLGLFWTRVYEDVEFIRGLQQGRSLLIAQLYLDFLEAISLTNRTTVPVFHRERWLPLVIRQSQAGTGSAALIKVGMDPTPLVGPQESNAFVQGDVFKVGGCAEFANAISYPLNRPVSSVLTCIVDDIVHPNVVLVSGQDFVVQDDTIFFLRTNDPFTKNVFPQRTLVNDDGTTDQEILLWTSDVLVDTEYVYRNLSYAMGVRAPSAEFYRNMTNRLWNLYNWGTPLSLLQSGIGAMLGEPTVIHKTEVVEAILSHENDVQIVTDLEVYSVSKTSTLRSACVVGAVMHMGDFFTETIRLYETMDPRKLNATSEFGDRLKTDLYAMFFDQRMLKSNVEFGVGASWELSNIIVDGFDSKGNPRLRFTLYGDPDDISLFWQDFWQYLEDHDLTSETCFQDYIDDIVLPVEGTVCGHVAPMEYFLRYFMKANAMLLVVEKDKLSSPPTDRDPMSLLDLIRPALPAHVQLLVVEQIHVTEDYDLADLNSEIGVMYGKILASSAQPGGPSSATLTYQDRPPVVRWISQCRS